MKLLERYKKVIGFKVDKPKETVYSEIIKMWKGNKMDEDKIQIVVQPSFYGPFAPRGFINLQISEVANETEISCEIVPTSITQTGLYVLASFLIAWTIIGLLISHNFYSFLTIVFGWTMILAVIHFTQVLNQGKLESYITYILSSIKTVKLKSVA